MHLPATSAISLDDVVEAVDLRQKPADLLALSFADSDLSGLARARRRRPDGFPDLRLARLRDLRHPMSVDLWIDGVAARAKVIVVRLLGGFDWWRYGCERLSVVARERGVALALLPGEDSDLDGRLIEASTMPRAELEDMLACFRAGGPANLDRLMGLMAARAGHACATPALEAVPRVGAYVPELGVVENWRASIGAARDAPAALVLFYRSMLLAGDVAPVDLLCEALRAKGFAPLALFIPSLKDSEATRFIEVVAREAQASVIIATTSFAGAGDDGSLFERLGAPVLQAAIATTRREAWIGSPRGLAPADMAMHIALPEIDGRVFAGAISLKGEEPFDEDLGFSAVVNAPEADRVAFVAARARRLVQLQRTPRARRRVLVMLPDYPAAPGRAGYAVGLDAPESVLVCLRDLRDAGYDVGNVPARARDLLGLLAAGRCGVGSEDYATWFSNLPDAAREKVVSAWGAPDGRAFEFRAAEFGAVVVAMAPDRGRAANRRADYHDPDLPPSHDLLAFGRWLQRNFDVVVHMGAHGAIEWLPGKAVALSAACFPEIVTGATPIVYPFIVSNPGEAAQAKRRVAAVTLGHLPPPLRAGLDDTQRKLERLVDEYAQADGFDRRRRDRLGKLVVETARQTGLARVAGVGESDDPDQALRRIDAWLCDLKEFAIKDGLHVFARVAENEADLQRRACADAERDALLRALDGKFTPPGPAGAPSRGRRDVMPTGRNLFASDPRAIPTPTACDLGEAAASETLRRYCQDHGDWPRALVIDLWGSASLRTGGEEIAQGLALMGCRPRWDTATGRVTGIDVLPPATLGRPRVDVTWRISGLFRDMFPTQIALIDAAVAAIARREDAPGDNPLAERTPATGALPRRIFGPAPGAYGAGTEELLASGEWRVREDIGAAYLAGASHAYCGSDAAPSAAPDEFAGRIAETDLLVHVGDDPGRDLLEGAADVAHIGGFAAALAALGANADIIVLDTSDPARPQARSLPEAIERIVRTRAVNARFISGMMRHGPRGASELLETVDRLIGFAETTRAISGALIDLVYEAYLVDPDTRAFLLRENPAAARAMAARFADARRRDLWRPLRNSIDADLAALTAHEARP